MRTNSRIIGYYPTATIILLFVATPASWRRRAWGLLWGVLVMQAYVLLRLTVILVADGFAAPTRYALFKPSELSLGILARVKEVVVDNPTSGYVVALFVWGVVSLLTGILAEFLREGPA